MSQYRVKLKNTVSRHQETVSVWAEDASAAGTQAIKIGRRLLSTPALEVVETIDMSPSAPRPLKHAREHRKSPHGPVTTRFIGV